MTPCSQFMANLAHSASIWWRGRHVRMRWVGRLFSIMHDSLAQKSFIAVWGQWFMTSSGRGDSSAAGWLRVQLARLWKRTGGWYVLLFSVLAATGWRVHESGLVFLFIFRLHCHYFLTPYMWHCKWDIFSTLPALTQGKRSRRTGLCRWTKCVTKWRMIHCQ